MITENSAIVYKKRVERNGAGSRAFLFVGQYRDRKGVETLIKAYSLYREETENPWQLHCAGCGLL